MRRLKIAVVIGLGLLLSACGFHLRSASELPNELHDINLVLPANQVVFNGALKDLLSTMNVSISHSKTASPYTLVITDLSFIHDSPANVSASTNTVYTYTYSFEFSIESRSGFALVPARSISVTQKLNASPEQMITTNSAAKRIRTQLRGEALDMLFNELSSYGVKQALMKCNMNPEKCGLIAS